MIALTGLLTPDEVGAIRDAYQWHEALTREGDTRRT